MRHFCNRILAFFRTGNLDRDFDQEIETHLQMLAGEFERRGLASEDARRAARLQFGGITQLREAHRAARGLPLLDSLSLDVRYALRALRKDPGFTVLAVLTLSIGMAVNTAVFALWNAAALRPLQAVQPERVVQLAHAGRDPSFSRAEYAYYRDHSRSFSALAAAAWFTFSMSGVPAAAPASPGGIAAAAGLQFPRTLGASEPVAAAAISGNYFQLLGVPAALGRVIRPEEDSAAAEPVAMLSDSFWERRFSRDPAVLGRRLTLNGIDATIVGVTPQNFGGTSLVLPDLWTPVSLMERVSPGWSRFRVYGRLRPGIPALQARDELTALQTGSPADGPAIARPTHRNGFVVGPVSLMGQPGERDNQGPLILLVAFGLVLLIACANVASLLLARSAARQRETAIRAAIGASRSRIVRQLLTESAVMSVGAGAAAVAISWWLLRFLISQMPSSPFAGAAAVALNITPDLRVAAYIFFLSIASTAVFGLAPTLDASRPNLSSGLRDEGSAFGMRVRKSRLRDFMIAAQVTVCLLLLISAGLLARASKRALTADLGFDYRNILSLEIVFPTGSSAARTSAIRMQLFQELQRLPDVRSLAVASRLPLVHGGMRSFAVSTTGGSVDDPGTPDSWYTLVTPGYFETIGIAIVRGRDFTPQEARDGENYDNSPVIVSEATARKFWPGLDPLGKRLAFGPRRGDGPLSDGSRDARSASSFVIGVARDVRAWRLERVDDTGVYLPVTSAFGGNASGNNGRPMGVIAIRARRAEGEAIASVRRLLQSAHPELQASLGDARTAFTTQNAFIFSRLGAIGTAVIGILGLLMTSAGIYGTVAFAVTQRTQEIGIRMALGAARASVLSLVLRDTMRPVAAGLVLGFAAAAAVSRLMHAILFGLSTLDPIAFLGVSAFLTAVALLAGFVPARRATRVDPLVALRYE